MERSIKLTNTLLSCMGEYTITSITEENQNSEYKGFSFSVFEHTYRSRLAKLTPKKKGYFVAFWEKDINNHNQAYSYDESPNKIVISVIDDKRKGQFIFPKSVLLQQGVLRSKMSKGKMAMRVYPSWEQELNSSAEKSQKWQMKYFIDVSKAVDIARLTDLYFS